jgi:hypothetical protein
MAPMRAKANMASAAPAWNAALESASASVTGASLRAQPGAAAETKRSLRQVLAGFWPWRIAPCYGAFSDENMLKAPGPSGHMGVR